MAKKNKEKEKKEPIFSSKIKRAIIGLLLFLLAVISALGFWGLSGKVGEELVNVFRSFLGWGSLFIPLLFFFSGMTLFRTHYERFFLPVLISWFAVIMGTSGILGGFSENRLGGWLGETISHPLQSGIGFIPSQLLFLASFLLGVIIFWNLLYEDLSILDVFRKIFKKDSKEGFPIVKKVFTPKFESEKIASSPKKEEKEEEKPVSGKLSDLIPPIDLLENRQGSADPGNTARDSSVIKKTFADFHIPVTMSEINVGPTVTQYAMKPAEGIKLSKITSLADDLALALAKHPVRTEAPIPGKSLVGIEVPNQKREGIGLKDLLENKEFLSHPSSLSLVVGKNVSGHPIYADLAKMPHLLVAGATGSGKTIFLNTVILSLLYKNSPGDLRFILVDPKRVEFSLYKNLPHLLTSVIYDADKTFNALEWLIGEMERRFELLSEEKTRNIISYNQEKERRGEDKLPYIVLVIDELADLMASKGNEIEGGIVRIAQMARAVGIHLILATQRPSVEVITGLIKANITSRVSFQVASQVDSRTILDMGGAEKLLGSGDMLFVSSDNTKPRRIQAPYVSEKEVRKVVKWLDENSKGDEGIGDSLSEKIEEELEKPSGMDYEGGDEDPLYSEAKEFVLQTGKASASMLQRRLKVGYVRAARLLDMLEYNGVIGPSRGAKPREVFGRESEEEEGDDSWEKI